MASPIDGDISVQAVVCHMTVSVTVAGMNDPDGGHVVGGMGVTCRCHMSRFGLYDGRIPGGLCCGNDGGVRHYASPWNEVVKAVCCPFHFVDAPVGIRRRDSSEDFYPCPAFEMLFVVVCLLVVRIGLVVASMARFVFVVPAAESWGLI